MIMDGKKIAGEILEELKSEIAGLGFRPKLIDVVVGNDPVTESYVRIKGKRAAEIGIDFEEVSMPADISQIDLEKKIKELNQTENLCGLIVQLPLPAQIDKQQVVDQIDPKIDVDVLTSVNLGKMVTFQQLFSPATASAIIRILDYHNVELQGKNVLVIGAGDLVGKPVSFLLIQRKATVVIANESTTNLKELCLAADVIISGTGVPQLIKEDMVKEETVIVDAGTAETSGGISGDVDFDVVSKKVALITPVPGGVGPVTVAMLLANAVQAAKLTHKSK